MNTSHFVLGNSMVEPWPDSTQVAIFGLGCFWGAERKFWQLEGVYTTAVGYSGGEKLNPTYREVCNGTTGHAESVEVVFDNSKVEFKTLISFPELIENKHHQVFSQEEMDEVYLKISNIY